MMLRQSKAESKAAPINKAVFPPSHWKHILKLLGLIIVADGRVVKEEVDTYLDVVMELRCVIDPTIVMTRRMARDWFYWNKKELEAVIDGLAYDTELLAILKEIKALPQKLDVITGMVRIAVSDNDYHIVERGLIKKTILYWNISASDDQDIDYSDAEDLISISN